MYIASTVSTDVMNFYRKGNWRILWRYSSIGKNIFNSEMMG